MWVFLLLPLSLVAIGEGQPDGLPNNPGGRVDAGCTFTTCRNQCNVNRHGSGYCDSCVCADGSFGEGCVIETCRPGCSVNRGGAAGDVHCDTCVCNGFRSNDPVGG